MSASSRKPVSYRDQRAAPRRETLPLIALKSVLYVVAVWLYLRQLASGSAQMSAMIAAPLGALAAAWLVPKLRAGALLLVFLALVGLSWGLSEWLLDSTGVWMGIPPKPTLVGADIIFFAMLSFAVVFLLRGLTGRARLFSVFEAAFVIGAVVYTFAEHRNLSLDQPRFFSDWVFANGLDPQVLLRGLGAVVAALSVLMLLEADRITKLITSLATLLLVGWGVYALIKDVHIPLDVHTGGVGLTKKEQNKKGNKDGKGDKGGGQGKDGEGKGKDGEGKGKGGEGSGNGNGDGNGGGNSPPPPNPVAVSVFHATYEPPTGILYFRQQVLSKYDGHHLVAESDPQFDTDVITTFPSDTELTAAPVQNPDFHKRVPTSMYLLVDHPQPFALTNSLSIGPRQNPDPRRFVAAYSAVSLVPAQSSNSRLIGRASVGAGWTPEQREHYLARPDDPRYEALAEEILRDIDPRFMGEDLMKALLIKRHLEKNGFYTRKKTYSNDDDPTAAFLFGDMNGYCVHFAHSAAHLFRSVGIAARVAIGYAVDTRLQGGGSTVLIMADRAHAWPEIHVDGVGWVTFDIYPEKSDEVPQTVVSRSLESMLGELARDDKSAGKMADPNTEPFEMPWAAIVWAFALLLASLLLLAYLLKLARILLAGRNHRYALRATLDRFADVGERRAFGETRERFAARLAETTPSLKALTLAHLRAAYGAGADADWRALSAAVRTELRAALPWHRRLLGALNPIGWIFTR
ncbi:MAG: transglutaminase-like putative cysteine protease [Bradymonadia bacterium]|jgi:transglutaminase-like putative cysteine protease